MTVAREAREAREFTRPDLAPARAPAAAPGADPIRAWQVAVLAGVALLLVGLGVRHEPWFDEAQSWLIARDASLWNLLTVRTRHEGTPPLWQLLLILPARAGLPYRTMSAVSGAAALAGAWLMVRRAPFPVWLRAALPLTYYAVYQYGVVARSYCLLAPLLWLAAIGFRSRRRAPWRWTLPLILLAEVSVHGLIIAVSWGALRARDVAREWPALDRGERRRQATPLAALGLAALMAAAEAWPSADVSGGGSWHLNLALMGQLLSGPPLVALEWAGVAGLLVTLPWMWARATLAYFMLPATLLFLLFAVRYFSPWHAGVLVEVWIAALWVSWRRPVRRRWRWNGTVARLLPAAAAVLVAGQLTWTVQAAVFDVTGSYSGAPALADYIRAHHLERRVDAQGKWIVAVLPYFDGVVVRNYGGGHGPAYYPWSRSRDPLPTTWDVRREHAEGFVLAVESRTKVKVGCLPGYRLDAVFPGSIYIGARPYESETYVVFRRDPASRATVFDVCAVVTPKG